jgi:ferrous iron transport protein B
MPNYKMPSIKNIFYTIVEKTKAFIFEAGKIILAISIVLWFLATNGPSKSFGNAEEIIAKEIKLNPSGNLNKQVEIDKFKLEHSYLGMMGKTIEPAIKPLGYDWKIGIALISSFAAREVFVGTLATIYNVENPDDESSIKERMSKEVRPLTGKKRYDLPTGMSLLIFYAFAMQCMGTLAIVKRETNSWKWPIYQLISMTILAYVAAYFTYILFK